jgi:hypothetical protein
MMALVIPNDTELLAAVGTVALYHEHLNHVLRMTIKTIAGIRVDEALDATVYESSGRLRERIRKLARRLGEGEPLLKLQALLKRCKSATERRNDLVHNVWAQELGGELMQRGSDHTWHPLPSTADLMNLSKELQQLAHELNNARLDGGFLCEALSKRAVKAGA